MYLINFNGLDFPIWNRKRAYFSVFSSLKKEKIRRYIFKTREEAKAEIFDYIEVFYNRVQRQILTS